MFFSSVEESARAEGGFAPNGTHEGGGGGEVKAGPKARTQCLALTCLPPERYGTAERKAAFPLLSVSVFLCFRLARHAARLVNRFRVSGDTVRSQHGLLARFERRQWR